MKLSGHFHRIRLTETILVFAIIIQIKTGNRIKLFKLKIKLKKFKKNTFLFILVHVDNLFLEIKYDIEKVCDNLNYDAGDRIPNIWNN